MPRGGGLDPLVPLFLPDIHEVRDLVVSQQLVERAHCSSPWALIVSSTGTDRPARAAGAGAVDSEINAIWGWEGAAHLG